MKKLMSAFVIAAVCAMGSAAIAQTTTAKTDAKKAGAATKEAGRATGEAAKDAAKATGKATASAAKATTRAVTGEKLTATCNDGTTWTGKSKKGACSGHKGVQTWDKA